MIAALLAVCLQAEPWSPNYIEPIRRAAFQMPGEFPQTIRMESVNSERMPVSAAVEGGTQMADIQYPVFQIRYRHGWIVVDAAMGEEFVKDTSNWDSKAAEHVQRVLRDARLIVITHEHSDHIAGVIRSPYLDRIQQHTMLTRAQLHTLLDKPNDPRIKIDSATAARYKSVDYDSYLAIAPGVVLIKAAGHTPGSQMVFVHLQSGREFLLVGDVAWHSSGIWREQQKPLASTQEFGGEDREAIASQLHWLRFVTGVALVVSHDGDNLRALMGDGSFQEGFDFKDP